MSNSTALTKIENAQKAGALVFVDKDWLEEKTPLYKPETTALEINKETECFNISGKFMPKREVVDRIGEASGVDFIFGETKSSVVQDDACGKRTVYTSYAQGRRLMPDGAWRTSSKCDYEFDPVLRAMLDYDVTELTTETKQKQRKTREGKPYGSTLARYILELQKVAAQRANTGARLRVIRELVGMPTAFDGKDLDKPLYLGRIVQNTDYILKTPEGRAMATAKALGVDVAALFGARKPALAPSDGDGFAGSIPSDEAPEPENENGKEVANLAAEAAAADDPDFPDEPTGPGSPPQEKTEFDRLTDGLREFLEGYKTELDVTTKTGRNPYKLAQEEMSSLAATEETRRAMIERLRSYLKAKGINV
jgi:hypothetical protein